tara:strand:- start:278 stop:475 length:198 start_codon:yes stop_codon:yes gene_type:complete
MERDSRSLGRIFAIPAVIFATSLTGLLWALLVEGHQDWIAALFVGVSLFAILLRRRIGGSRTKRS